MTAKIKDGDEKTIATNRKAFHEYSVIETYETGIALQGSEVKSARAGKVNFKDCYAAIKKGEIFILNMNISPYEPASRFNHDPERPRKLLLHRNEIRRLIGKVEEKGNTLIPLRVYLKKGILKVELALVKGKRMYDKREAIAKRDQERDVQREFKSFKFKAQGKGIRRSED